MATTKSSNSKRRAKTFRQPTPKLPQPGEVTYCTPLKILCGTVSLFSLKGSTYAVTVDSSSRPEVYLIPASTPEQVLQSREHRNGWLRRADDRNRIKAGHRQ